VHRRLRAAAIAFAVFCLAVVMAPRSADAADTGEIAILVLKEHGVGGPTLAQPYVDRFTALIVQENGWAGARGQYVSRRGAVQPFVETQHPHYGMFSLAAFLALRKVYRLEVIGRVASTLAGGEQYFIVSKSARDLAGCKGRTLASDHTDDVRFVERVVARREFRLGEFQVLQNLRPLQSIYQVLRGEADCALIDDAQLAELRHLDAAGDVGVVWRSAPLPPMAVVAFPAAPAAERKAFQASLRGLCGEEPAKTACQEVGIRALDAASASDYAEVVSLYGD
jgi:ABC transporter, phosphonate, periplasmic substrate-binding protein